MIRTSILVAGLARQGLAQHDACKNFAARIGYCWKARVRPVGWLPHSWALALQFSFAHVDVDIYDPALACCDYIYPRLVSGGVMMFDDYGYPACRGERNAVDKFFADKSQPVIALPSGQGLVIKT